jgi:hypothetical protein
VKQDVPDLIDQVSEILATRIIGQSSDPNVPKDE